MYLLLKQVYRSNDVLRPIFIAITHYFTRQSELYLGSDGDRLPFEALPIAMQ